MTDENLMVLVADGEIAKLGVLFDRYQDRVYDYFMRMTNDADLCPSRGARDQILDLAKDMGRLAPLFKLKII